MLNNMRISPNRHYKDASMQKTNSSNDIYRGGTSTNKYSSKTKGGATRQFDQTDYGSPLINIRDTHVVESSVHDSIMNSKRDARDRASNLQTYNTNSKMQSPRDTEYNRGSQKPLSSQKAYLDMHNRESFNELKRKNFDIESRMKIMERQRK